MANVLSRPKMTFHYPADDTEGQDVVQQELREDDVHELGAITYHDSCSCSGTDAVLSSSPRSFCARHPKKHWPAIHPGRPVVHTKPR